MSTGQALLSWPPDPGTPTVATDLEGTLSAGVALEGMRSYLVTHGGASQGRWYFYRRIPGYVLRKAMGVNFQVYKNDWMRDMLSLFKGLTVEQFQEMSTWVVEYELWPKRRSFVIEELFAHLDAGRRVVILTGMYEPLLAALLQRLPGMEAIGTPLVFDDGHFTGELAADFNVGERKREQLQKFARDGKIYCAYGDTISDVPMLEMGEQAVAVHPDKGLKRLAATRNWRILVDERKG